MAESEAFRNAVASIRIVDEVPDGLEMVEVAKPSTHMTCNEPSSDAEVARPVVGQMSGDPFREIDLTARLRTLKSGDLERPLSESTPRPEAEP